jgi:uncharacterized protein (TIGR02145 family)
MALRRFLMIGFVAVVLVACGGNRNSEAHPDGESSLSKNVILSSGEGSCCSSSSAIAGDTVYDTRQLVDIVELGSKEQQSSVSGFSSSISEGLIDSSAVVKGTMTDERDGKIYKTVKIGTQIWMAENLNYTYTGVPYSYRYDNGVYTCDSTSWCYGNDPANCIKYGRLYTWAAAMDSVGTWSVNGKGCGNVMTCSPTYPVRGVCPEGWHLPDTTEWKILIDAVGGEDEAGKTLKSISGWSKSAGANGGNGTDAYSFTVLPVGFRYDYGRYAIEGENAAFWSSSELNRYFAYIMFLWSHYGSAKLEPRGRGNGFSVRCVKD